jgi:pyridoxine 4-dehydrogenase
MKKKKDKGDFHFATKLAPFPWRIGASSMTKAASLSTARLQRPIDCLQLHWPPTLQWQEREYLESFANSVNEGSAIQIGLSNYGPKSIVRADKIVRELGQNIYSNQVQFSLLSRYPINNGLVETCAELGIQPISYSPLALGLLTDKVYEHEHEHDDTIHDDTNCK